MQEDYLHYVWLHKKFDALNLRTVQGEPIEIISVGQHNSNSGPDFFNAQLKIDRQLWAGNVEIHVKASDWFVHGHETDPNYDNVILHVVWENDTDIYRQDNTTIPALELKRLVSKEALHNYNRLFSKTQKWINCEKDFYGVDDFRIQNWLERLYFERLERKSSDIEQLLKASSNDWEAVLFKMLTKNFGLKVNGASFLSLAHSFDFSVVRKLRTEVLPLEALFFGQFGLLADDVQHVYYLELRREYLFLRKKFGLSNKNVAPLQFFRLRPSNFPTIRLSQLANLYYRHEHLFSKVMEADTIDVLYELFSVGTSAFWETHYTFRRASHPFGKVIPNAFTDLLLINTILPLKFHYDRSRGIDGNEAIMDVIQNIASEKNSIIEKFNALKPICSSALQSQALLQLKNEYCDKNKCMQCAIGNTLLTGNV
jgi:hypothetical protein